MLFRLGTLAMMVVLIVTGCAPPNDAANDPTEPPAATIVEPTEPAAATPAEDEAPEMAEATPVGAEDAPVASAVEQMEPAALQDALTALYETTNPSAVFIIVYQDNGAADAQPPRPLGSGSGFVYSDEGHIITNNHVVAPGNSYEIVFADGERRFGELIGADPDSDLAVLQADDLPERAAPLTLARMEDVRVGQLAVAIGSPFGEQGSMTLGIISGLGRSLPTQQRMAQTTYSLPQVIQTDTPINPGNSGGPLLNLDGEVIGVNAAIASATGTSSGVGFSIPVSIVRHIVPTLIEEGEVVYPYIGATFDGEISLVDQGFYGLSQTEGTYIIDIAPGGPADEAGLIAADPETGQGGDLIVAVNGEAVGSFADLNSYLVLEGEVGETIELTVVRGDDTVTVPLTLGERPSS
jgi:2-alkenal reductase